MQISMTQVHSAARLPLSYSSLLCRSHTPGQEDLRGKSTRAKLWKLFAEPVAEAGRHNAYDAGMFTKAVIVWPQYKLGGGPTSPSKARRVSNAAFKISDDLLDIPQAGGIRSGRTAPHRFCMKVRGFRTLERWTVPYLTHNDTHSLAFPTKFVSGWLCQLRA